MTDRDRLDRLERSNRRLHAMLGLTLGTILVGLMLGVTRPHQPEVIQAQRLEIVDDQGQVLVMLGSLSGGGVLTVSHPAGASARLHAQERAGEFAFFNQQQTSINLSAGLDGRGTIETFDAAGNRLIGLTSDDQGGVILVRNSAGKVMTSLSAGDDAGRLKTMNAAGTELVTIGTTRSGAGLLAAFDQEGRRMATFGSVNGEGVVLTSSPDGAVSGAIGKTR